MYLLYVDEAGDPGIVNSPTRFFVLSGLVIHELRWLDTLESLIQFKRGLSQSFGLRFREEIHAADWISKPNAYIRSIPRHQRYYMLSLFAGHLAKLSDLSIINITIDKQGKPTSYDVFDRAWTYLLQRYENTVAARNFRGPGNTDERGLLFADQTNEPKLRLILRKMRRFNYVPSQFGGLYSARVTKIVEDPMMKDSAQSLFIQAADLAAFALYQHHAPNAYLRQKSRQRLFQALSPLFLQATSPNNPPYWIVSY